MEAFAAEFFPLLMAGALLGLPQLYGKALYEQNAIVLEKIKNTSTLPYSWDEPDLAPEDNCVFLPWTAVHTMFIPWYQGGGPADGQGEGRKSWIICRSSYMPNMYGFVNVDVVLYDS